MLTSSIATLYGKCCFPVALPHASEPVSARTTIVANRPERRLPHLREAPAVDQGSAELAAL